MIPDRLALVRLMAMLDTIEAWPGLIDSMYLMCSAYVLHVYDQPIGTTVDILGGLTARISTR